MSPGNGTVVLAIDDDPNVLDLLQEHLADAGYHVIGVTRGEEGLHKARQPDGVEYSWFRESYRKWAPRARQHHA